MENSLFSSVNSLPDDPILSLTGQFLADPRPCKVNLGVGMYMDENGQTPILEVVREAKEALAKQSLAHTYIPQTGLPQYDRLVQKLIFGAESDVLQSGRAVTVQTLGGTGAIKLGVDLMRSACGLSTGSASIPTWGNHNDILKLAGYRVQGYRYYNAQSHSLDFEAMCEDLKSLPGKALVILHACCHNPTGYDLNRDQWLEVINICREHKLVPFLDMAYQGFKDGLQEDAHAVRLFANAGLDFLVASSFSKSFNLYGERVGALTVVTHSSDEAQRITSHLKICARANYSNPPAFGARIVEFVLSDSDRFAHWEAEVAGMRDRIKRMRQLLVNEMGKVGAKRDFSFVTEQAGMFSFTGLSSEQIARLATDYGIYAVKNGRICICGLNERNVSYVAGAFADVM